MRARSREFRDRGSGGLSRAVAAVGAMAFAVSAMAAASGWLAAAEEPLSVKESESWDSERAFIEMERLRMEIRVLRGLASAQAALLAWNRERADGGAGPAVLAAGLCAEPALKPWCRTLPASFGAAADAGERRTGGGDPRAGGRRRLPSLLGYRAARAAPEQRRHGCDPGRPW